MVLQGTSPASSPSLGSQREAYWRFVSLAVMSVHCHSHWCGPAARPGGVPEANRAALTNPFAHEHVTLHDKNSLIVSPSCAGLRYQLQHLKREFSSPWPCRQRTAVEERIAAFPRAVTARTSGTVEVLSPHLHWSRGRQTEQTTREHTTEMVLTHYVPTPQTWMSSLRR